MEPQLFVPKSGQQASFSFLNTPTYLFRLHAPSSAGSTSPDYVKSPAWLRRTDETNAPDFDPSLDLLQLPPERAAKGLGAHLKWSCQYPCNLMSWSSSLLFVLQYGLFRYGTNRDKLLSSIQLIILDTRHFPRGTFLRDLEAISRFYADYPDLGKMKGWRERDLYFGEYLTQGCLKIGGNCSQVSMQQLIDGGLFQLCPDLASPPNDWHGWANPVCRIRNTVPQPEAVNQKHVRIAITMAQTCVEDHFVVPFAVILLGLQRRRQSDDRVISNAFRAMFTGK